jgi:hypothetical protein
MRRTLLDTAVVLFAGALAPAMPSAAGADPAAFITNLGNQLRVVVRNTSPEQRLAGFRELFREDFDVPGLGRCRPILVGSHPVTATGIPWAVRELRRAHL